MVKSMIFKLKKKTNNTRFDFDKTYKGKKKSFIAEIIWSQYHNYWYFLITYPNDKGYNSLWDGLKLDSQDECEKAAEKYIDEHINQ